MLRRGICRQWARILTGAVMTAALFVLHASDARAIELLPETPVEQPQEHTGDRKAKFIEVCNKMIPAAIKDTLKAYNCRSLEELGLDQIDGFYREAKRVEAGMMQEVEF